MIQFYKPNKKVTGTAASFWSTKEGDVWVSMIKQTAPIGQNPFLKGKDDNSKKVVSKLSLVEAAGLIDVVNRRSAWEAFHESEKQKLNMFFKLTQYEINGEKKEGFAFSILKQDKSDSQNKQSFSVGLNNSEAAYLKEYLSYCLQVSFENAKVLAYEKNKNLQEKGSRDKAHESETVSRNVPVKTEVVTTNTNTDEDLW